MDRRTFLKAATVGTAAACVSTVTEARPNLEPASEAVGMLYDSTLCVGCKACVAACKETNDMPPVGDDVHYDSARDLSGNTLNVIKIYKDGTAEVKDQGKNGFAFEKRSCMHCVDPGCVSVCPTTAMRRHPKTGIVTHHADVCIGCRSCTVGCPYNVPQFQYDDAFGSISKCQMCNQKGVERIDKGGMTACAEVCPTGATLFGPRDMLMEEAKRRQSLKIGDTYNFPRGDLSKPESYHEKIMDSGYIDHVWGEKEAGGTNVLHISNIAFEKLGMPPLEDRSAASISETVQHSVYSYMALPAVALAGLVYTVRKNKEGGDDE